MKTGAAVLWILLAGVWSLQAATHPRPPSSKQQAAPAKTPSAEQSNEQSRIDPAKEADIRRLLDVAGATTLIEQTMDAAVKNIKPLMTNSLPPGDYREKLVDLFFDKFRSKADKQQFIDLVVPIYDKYLSDEDVKGLIQFYSTPLGHKALSVLPRLAIESQEAGRKWGETLGRQSLLEVIAEHPDLAKAMEAAQKGSPRP
jgi:hypothetical protein